MSPSSRFLTAPLTGLVKPLIEQQLAAADLQIKGDRPWDLQIHNPQLFSREDLHKFGSDLYPNAAGLAG